MDSLPNCPFCPFSDADSYFVIQHVELCHSETGNSPFVVKDDDGIPNSSQELVQDDAGATRATSEDNYIDCECGECLLLAEFDSHLEMHIAEGTMASEEGGQSAMGNTIFSHSSDNISVYKMQKDPSYSSIDTWQAPTEVKTLQPDLILPRAASLPTRTHKSSRRDRDWKDLLFGPSITASGVRSAKAKHQTARRLGVCNHRHKLAFSNVVRREQS